MPEPAPSTPDSLPWQLATFRHSLKKQLKLAALIDVLGEVNGQQGLLLTCGDNNGAMNWHFRAHGGSWTWGDLEGRHLEEMRAFLGEPVHHVHDDHFPFANEQFDFVISIDVLEHLEQDGPCLAELYRVVKPGGRTIVTVPSGDANLLANRLKTRVGMTPEIYGHTRWGYTRDELSQRLEEVGFLVKRTGGYSRFFTEIVELAINLSYVRLLNRKKGQEEPGNIAPTTTGGEFRSHGWSYRLYTLLYPLFNAFTTLDQVIPGDSVYAVVVEASKP